MSSKRTSARNKNIGKSALPEAKREEEKGTWPSLIIKELVFQWQNSSRDKDERKPGLGEDVYSSPPVTEMHNDDSAGRCGGCGSSGKMGTKCLGCNNYFFDSIPNGSKTELGASVEERIAGWWRRVTKSTVGSEVLPEIGQACLIIKGEERQGLGHMGVVLRLTEKRVVVGYRDWGTGKPVE